MIDKRDAQRTGTERAAILLLTLGEQEAAQVLKHMGAKEVQRIGAAMAKLANVSSSSALKSRGIVSIAHSVPTG